MEMTLAEAATATGLTKPGLVKDIRTGRLSGKKDAEGKGKLDANELIWVTKT